MSELLNLRRPGVYHVKIRIPLSLLAPGIYHLGVACGVPNLRLIDEREGPTFKVSAVGRYAEQWSQFRQDVIVALPLAWKTELRQPSVGM
jgi:hypothetical protein